MEAECAGYVEVMAIPSLVTGILQDSHRHADTASEKANVVPVQAKGFRKQSCSLTNTETPTESLTEGNTSSTALSITVTARSSEAHQDAGTETATTAEIHETRNGRHAHAVTAQV